MKGCILCLAFVSLAAGSVLQPEVAAMSLGFCKNPPIAQEFEMNQFFNGKWFVWKRYGNIFFDAFGSCTATDARVNGSTIQLLHYEYNPFPVGYVSVYGEAPVSFSQHGGLPFPVSYKLLNRFTITIPYSIVGTDYDNWAAVYFCRQLLGVKIEASWVMTRKRGVTVSNEKLLDIKKSLNTLDQDLNDFSLEDNNDCPPGEPSF